MNQTAIKAILNGLSYEELETVITEAQKNAAFIAEDDLYNFERPAYSYWASGGGGNFGFMTPGERIAWNRKRERLTERAHKYSQRQRLTIQPPPPPAPVGWLLFNGIGIGAAVASGIWLALFLYLAYGR